MRARRKRLEPHLEEKFLALGFEQLTEIQRRAAPEIYRKNDSLVIAPTGSGKTECAVIPIFSRLKGTAGRGRIRALYITPLRALNRDVFRRIIEYAKGDELTIAIRHGDTPQSARRKMVADPPDVLITTPETLVVLLVQEKMLKALSELEWVVIDEVHELLSSERGAQLSLSLERLAVNSSRDLTRVGLSATVGNAMAASKFVSGTKRRCRVIQDRSVRRYDVEIKYVDGSIADAARAIVRRVESLVMNSPVLLFTNSRGEAELLASIIRDSSSIPVEMHHGSLSREVRHETEESLREGRRGIVVCTSSLELGLDIGSVELVAHYGSPRQVAKLVQRIGRSRHNRNSSAKGLIVTNSPDDEYEARAILERVSRRSIEDQRIHYSSLDVLAHHLVGMTMQLGRMNLEDALKIVLNAYPFREITRGEVIEVLELLDSSRLVYFDREKSTFGKGSRAFKYHYENLSTIPDMLKFKVFDTVGKRVIGTLDQRFVGNYGEAGNVFVLRGSQWRILIVDEKSLLVNVEPFRAGGVTVPYWEGESIPVDYTTARKVGELRSATARDKVIQNSSISDLDLGTIPDGKTVIAESSRSAGTVILHACFGTRINATLSTIFSSTLSALSGFSVEARSDAYRIALSSSARISEEQMRGLIDDVYDLETVVAASLSGTHNANWKTWCVSKKFGIVGRRAVYDRRSAKFLYDRYSGTPISREALRELFHDRYDLDGTRRVIEMMQSGEISVKWVEVTEFSTLADPILDHTAKYYSAPASVDAGIMEMVKKRLYETVMRLVCARCGVWDRTFEIAEAPERPTCPYCKGRQIAATFLADRDLPDIIRRNSDGKRISREERHRFEKAWKTASLIENFGKTALVVLAGYGVGADTAARILRNMVDEKNLFKQIYEAERQYVMTRGFWD